MKMKLSRKLMRKIEEKEKIIKMSSFVKKTSTVV